MSSPKAELLASNHFPLNIRGDFPIFLLLVSCIFLNRFDFLSCSWYSAAFWIQDEKNVDNALMSEFLTNSAYHKTVTFHLLTSALHQRDRENTKNWEETWPGQMTPRHHRDIPQHTVSCTASKVWEKLVGVLLRNWMGIHQHEWGATAICILHFDCYFYYSCCSYS